VESSPLDPFLLDVHALELDMGHLELDCFTCGYVSCLVMWPLVNMIHFIIVHGLIHLSNK
jgi:hypothetical protein